MARKKRESDLSLENRIDDPIPAPGIGSRISAVADLYKSRMDASSKCGISSDTLRRWEREGVTPSFDALACLAHGVGVSLDWLATGKGSMLLGDESPHIPSTMSRDIMADVIEVVLRELDNQGRTLPPDKMSQLMLLIHDEILESEQSEKGIDKGKVIRLIKLAS